MPNILATVLLSLAAVTSGGVPPDVVSVVSGGYWESGGNSGTYRVVVVNSGFEHVTSRVFVEWVSEPRSARDSARVVSAVEPTLPFGQGTASLTATLKPLSQGKMQVLVSGVISTAPEQAVSATITATAPGQAYSNGG
jgi:ribosomal protein L11 methylase PrmA